MFIRPLTISPAILASILLQICAAVPVGDVLLRIVLDDGTPTNRQIDYAIIFDIDGTYQEGILV
jgi:hypothetical protein